MARARQPKTVEFDLSVNVDFGPEYGKVNVIDDRRVPFTGTVFAARHKIVPAFANVLFKAASMRPKMIRDMIVAPVNSVKKVVPGAGEPDQAE